MNISADKVKLLGVFSKQRLDQLLARLHPGSEVAWSVFGDMVSDAGATNDGAVNPSGTATGLGDALNSPRGVLMAVVAVNGASTPFSQQLMAEIVKTYDDIPPDVDRLVALRATLDQVMQTLKGLSATASNPVQASITISAVTRGQWYAVNAGGGRGYHVHANGRIDAVRLEPTAQRKLESDDSVLLCSSSVSEKLEEYDIALSLYSRSPQGAVGHLLDMAKKKGANGALVAVVFGPQRSLLESVFGRSGNR